VIKQLFKAALAVCFFSVAAAAEDMRFIVFGDAPYNDHEYKVLTKIAGDLRTQGQHRFAIHYGDTKKSSLRCTDAILEKHQALIFSMGRGPVFFTPGDNDWTDCDRQGDDELNILDNHLMPLYFSADKRPETRFDLSGWDVARQEGRPENARWRVGGVQFGLLHHVATENGRDEIDESDPQVALDRVDARDADNLAWLSETFTAATGAEALVLALHADPTVGDETRPACSPETQTGCHPHKLLTEALKREAEKYGKPVLLVHGDTMPYCYQSGYLGAANLFRLNGPGDKIKPAVTEVLFSGGHFTFNHIGEGKPPENSCPLRGE